MNLTITNPETKKVLSKSEIKFRSVSRTRTNSELRNNNKSTLNNEIKRLEELEKEWKSPQIITPKDKMLKFSPGRAKTQTHNTPQSTHPSPQRRQHYADKFGTNKSRVVSIIREARNESPMNQFNHPFAGHKTISTGLN